MKGRRFGSWDLAATGSLCAFVSACGSGSTNGPPAGDCGRVQPCGGDLVGTWDIVSACLPAADGGTSGTLVILGQTCPGVTAVSASISEQGTLTFDSNSTFEETVTQATSTVTLSIPASCFPGTSCAQLGAEIAQDAGASVASISCTGTSMCLCTSTAMPVGVGGALGPTLTAMGTYSASGSSLTFTTQLDGGGIGQSSGDYCVVGNELHLLTVTTSMNMGAMGTVVIEGDSVAVKR